MILESFDSFEIAKSLGFTYDKEYNGWNSHSEVSLRDIKFKQYITNGFFPFRMINSYDNFSLSFTKNLKSAVNLPIHVFKNLVFNDSSIKDLSKLPTKYIDGELFISDNDEITNLDYNLERVNIIILKNLKNFENFRGLENLDSTHIIVENLPNFTLDYMPKDNTILSLINCDNITNLKGLNKKLFNLTLSNMNNLTSLEGVQSEIRALKIINCPNIPLIEKDYVINVQMTGKGFGDNYFLGLLEFIMKSKRDSEINTVHWSESFSKNVPNLSKSFKGISKFNI